MLKEKVGKLIIKLTENQSDFKNKVKTGYYKDFKTIRKI